MAMMTKYLKNTVLGRIFGQKKGIEMGVWSKTVNFIMRAMWPML
jgi:hypothetical protein